jgi:hypothetical protein
MKITRLLCGIAVAAATIIASQAFAASPSDAEAAYAVAGLKRIGPSLRDECGKAVTPSLRAVSLGGSVGSATVLQIDDATCYGSAGSRLISLKSEGGQLRPIFDNSAGGFQVLSSHHLGVSDIELDVPGKEISIWRWNGTAYELTTADGSRAEGSSKEICGQVLFYPGSFMIRDNGAEIFIENPKYDPKDIQSYLNARPPNACYCVSGDVRAISGRRNRFEFTGLSALKTCGGKVLK